MFPWFIDYSSSILFHFVVPQTLMIWVSLKIFLFDQGNSPDFVLLKYDTTTPYDSLFRMSIYRIWGFYVQELTNGVSIVILRCIQLIVLNTFSFCFPCPPQETKLVGLKSQITIPSPTSISTRCLQLPAFPNLSFWGFIPPRGWCRGHAWLRFRSWTWTIQGTVFVAESRKRWDQLPSDQKNSVFSDQQKPATMQRTLFLAYLLNIKVFC